MRQDERTEANAGWFRAAVFATLIGGCESSDGEQAVADTSGAPAPTDGEGEGEGDGDADCRAEESTEKALCIERGMQWITRSSGPSLEVVLVDDPDAVIPVEGGILLPAGSENGFVGRYGFEGGFCSVGCGWCQPGQSLCTSGFDEQGYPQCSLCFDVAGESHADQTSACADLMLACSGGAPDDDDTTGGADETG